MAIPDKGLELPVPAQPTEDAGHAVMHAAERLVDQLNDRVSAAEATNSLLPDNTRLVRWAALILLGCAVILVPWIAIAAITLPSHQLSENYDVAWAGYDVVLLVGLLSTAVCTLRRSVRLPIAAAATGALLGADAWFDVLTSPGGWDLVEALAMSALAELPLATACFWLAMHSQDVIEQRLRLLAGRSRRR
jgi:hypothetical protein